MTSIILLWLVCAIFNCTVCVWLADRITVGEMAGCIFFGPIITTLLLVFIPIFGFASIANKEVWRRK